MAEPLKNQFGMDVVLRLAASLRRQSADFDERGFVSRCKQGYEALELMPRGLHIAHALREFLPPDYPEAIEQLITTLGPRLTRTENNGMAPFFYLPHALFIAQYGLDHFEESMRANYEITQRFTAEFSIRPFLVRYPTQTLARLRDWTQDDSVHVRRLVSEGTRPRLPWASHWTAARENPRITIPLLELLKDDPELYVRRSVANHLNDIGKDHPEVLCQIAERWLRRASPERLWLVKHALRSLVKQGHPEAFRVLGFHHQKSPLAITLSLSPEFIHVGETLIVRVTCENPTARNLAAIIDLRVDFLKSNGAHGPKTFKLKHVELPPRSSLELKKQISFRKMTTRRHYPGVHHLAVLMNGQSILTRDFELKN
ncbi:MAG: DNA alkylation repair protein [Planctomycetaceae bacterium]|nr:DNA alkylation repair protein [Planctomycetaceae bacterium]